MSAILQAFFLKYVNIYILNQSSMKPSQVCDVNADNMTVLKIVIYCLLSQFDDPGTSELITSAGFRFHVQHVDSHYQITTEITTFKTYCSIVGVDGT